MYATAGSDGTVRVWSIRLRRQLHVRQLPRRVSGCSLAYRPDGAHLAVGMSDGSVGVLDETLGVVTGWRHAKEAITALRFAPDSSYLAVGSEDCNVYIYASVGDQYIRHAVCRKHSGPVASLDFAQDSRHLQTASTEAKEVLFFHVSGTELLASSPKAFGLSWNQWSSVRGWAVDGCFAASLRDGGELTRVDTGAAIGTVATGDDIGFVRLFRYPCTDPAALHKRYVPRTSLAGGTTASTATATTTTLLLLPLLLLVLLRPALLPLLLLLLLPLLLRPATASTTVSPSLLTSSTQPASPLSGTTRTRARWPACGSRAAGSSSSRSAARTAA